jgi:hypothetical protein
MHHQQYVQNSCDTVYPRNMVCFRYISMNTLHNGDDDDIINYEWHACLSVSMCAHTVTLKYTSINGILFCLLQVSQLSI